VFARNGAVVALAIAEVLDDARNEPNYDAVFKTLGQ